MSECNCPRIDVQVVPAPVIDIQSGIGPQGPAGYTPVKGVDYFDGQDGRDGKDGAPGADGQDGYTPVKGVDYTDGADGTTFTPTVSAEGVISWTNDGGKTNPQPVNIKGPQGPAGQDGQPGRDGQDGAPGQDGQDGVSPTIAVTDITGGHRVTITDAAGAHSFDVMDGEDGQGAVQDVQVAGLSVLSDGVANVPMATASTLGVVKAGNGLIAAIDGTITIAGASPAIIKAGTNSRSPLIAARQHESTFYGLAKAAGSDEKNSALPVGQYTESAKSAISTMLSAPVTVSGTTPTINALPGIQYVCGEVATLDITLPASGCVDVVFTSGSTPTVLTVTPPTGVTVKWANGFDPTSLEANTTYEINIKDGLGVAGSWS